MPHIDIQNVLWKEIEGKVTVLQLETGSFFELNPTGSAVWKMLAEGCGEEEIRRKLIQTYNASSEKLAADIRNFITQMLSQGLLQP